VVEQERKEKGLMEDTQNILNIITGVVTVASILVSLLPVPEEGSRLQRVYKLVDVLALNILKKKK
jgi:hypothetical protein